MADKSRIEWRPIPEWPNYEVSSCGKIRNSIRGNLLNLMVDSAGYHIFYARRKKKIRVHRAVLSAFVGPCPDGMECRHLNGIPSDNRLENLAWGTRKEQTLDKFLHGTQPYGETSKSAKLTEAQVFEIRQLRQSHSTRALGRMFGVSHTAIRRACNGLKWKHLGVYHGR